eukprot:m.251841 g.251841  ORF g.251841 m.251841 type:complete len:422 (-) comp17430_c0_seq1:144-1409(-)
MVVIVDGEVVPDHDPRARMFRSRARGEPSSPPRGNAPQERAKKGVRREDQLRLVLRYGLPFVLSLGITALVASYFGFTAPIKELSVSNPNQLKDVFFSGQPWVIACTKPSDSSIPQIVYDASAELRQLSVHTGTLDCEDPLPDSGKTVFERFGISRGPKSGGNVVFLTGNGQRPVRVDPQHLETVGGFVSHVSNFAQPRLLQPKTQAELEEFCLKRKACAVVLAREKLSSYHQRVLRDAIQKHRNVTFAYLRLKRGALTADPALPAPEEGAPRLIYFQTEKGRSAPTAFVLDDEFTSSNIVEFFRHGIYGAGVRLSTMPTLPGERAGTSADGEREARKARRDAERTRQQGKKRKEAESGKKADGGKRDDDDGDIERERQRRREMDEEASTWFEEADNADDDADAAEPDDDDEGEAVEIDAD